MFSVGRNGNMSGSDCILADRGLGSEISRALATRLDSEAGRRVLAKDLAETDVAPECGHGLDPSAS
jgi:hypothetical protein